MDKLTPFAKKVLDLIEPDRQKQQEMIQKTAMAPVCTSQDMEKFVLRIRQAAAARESVLVAGDYDADGILSTAIMVSGLRSLGIRTGFYIPDRIREGYGLKPKTVRMAHEKGYSLIITVDNGVKAEEAAAEASHRGIDLIITDHHVLEKAPEATALVHPQTMGEEFSTLCGAGVAYECMRALSIETPQQLMYAAVASVADCMEVRQETRAIIQEGMALLNSQGEMHLNALSKDMVHNETTVAFQIAPRINSVGRLANLANANNMVRYFLSQVPEQVYAFARTVDDLNTMRKQMTEAAVAKANALCRIARPVLLVKDPAFHEGIIGLAAGQMCSQYGKPVIVGTHGTEGIKCSMRAPKGFHCLEFLQDFDGYLTIGGHAQAAGFTIPYEQWDAFEKFVFHHGLEAGFEPVEQPVLPVTPEEITVENIESLDILRPFGTGFELPEFELQHPQIESIYDLSAGRHRKFMLSGGVQALHFNQTSADAAASVLSISSMKGTLDINRYQGRKTPSFLIDEIVYY